MSQRKGILLAGGTGQRMWPVTTSVSKHLLPIYDKPMIFYPLCTLMQAGVRDVLIITTPQDQAAYQLLLKDGSQWGLSITYAVQPSPDGMAQAFTIGSAFLGRSACALMLGDNLLHGEQLAPVLQQATQPHEGATIFAREVNDPSPFGVVEFCENHRAISIEEKPSSPRSNWAVAGLYLYDNRVVDIAQHIKPSARGELELAAINHAYLETGDLAVVPLDDSVYWVDAGTPDSLLNASIFVRDQKRNGQLVGSPKHLAASFGWINPVGDTD